MTSSLQIQPPGPAERLDTPGVPRAFPVDAAAMLLLLLSGVAASCSRVASEPPQGDTPGVISREEKLPADLEQLWLQQHGAERLERSAALLLQLSGGRPGAPQPLGVSVQALPGHPPLDEEEREARQFLTGEAALPFLRGLSVERAVVVQGLLRPDLELIVSRGRAFGARSTIEGVGVDGIQPVPPTEGSGGPSPLRARATAAAARGARAGAC